MSSPDQIYGAQWVQCTTTFISKLPVLKVPFQALPDIYAPEKTVLELEDGAQAYAFKWCYLNRRGGGKQAFFDMSSLSSERILAMPLALTRLSTWFRFKNFRPKSNLALLNFLSQFLEWADQPQHGGRYESILSDPDLALYALRGHHTYLRSQLQSHQIVLHTAGVRDQRAIACMSEIHGRAYRDEIEPLQCGTSPGTRAPASEAVAQFGSTLQAIFDSAAALILRGDPAASVRTLRICAADDTQSVLLKERYEPLRLMELACVSYAGLVFVDSGANLSVLTQYEEPADLHEQLADPDRINLKERAIKFRAGGKEVDVFLTATTVTRLKNYLDIRQALVAALECSDIAPLFIQCGYAVAKRGPTGVRPLDRDFRTQLRRKIAGIGVTLPSVTLRQLRAYAQQSFVRTAPLAVAAKRMGHSVETAVRAYCKALEATHRGEMSDFLGSLHRTVLDASEVAKETGSKAIEVIPAGACIDYGNPAPVTHSSAIEPDCRKVEGCFFCPNYRVHADERDMRKLMSCRRVLAAITPLHGDAIQTQRVYSAIVDRIDALLEELKRRLPKAYESVRVDIEESGQLTGYWARKVQQLHLLGLLPSGTGNNS
jgi:hypothetical protein